MPSGETRRQPAVPPHDSSAREDSPPAAAIAMAALAESINGGAIALTDDRGTGYALRVTEIGAVALTHRRAQCGRDQAQDQMASASSVNAAATCKWLAVSVPSS